MLRNRGMDTLFVCGVTTEVCVNTMVREGMTVENQFAKGEVQITGGIGELDVKGRVRRRPSRRV